MNIQDKEIFLKKSIVDKRNPDNILFEIEVYKNKKFKFNYKFSYRYYNFNIKKSNNNICELEIYLTSNNKVVNKFSVPENKLYIY